MIRWNEVTWYSGLASGVFFLVVLPIIIFYIGRQYKLVIDSYDASEKTFLGAAKTLETRGATTSMSSSVSSTSTPIKFQTPP